MKREQVANRRGQAAKRVYVHRRRGLAATIGIKLGVNVTVAGLLLTSLLVAQIEAPKESIHRPGLAPADQTALCESHDAVRVGCE